MLGKTLRKTQKIHKSTKTFKLNFNCQAIMSVVLHDDILVLNYMTKHGTQEELMFPDLGDIDAFFYSTMDNYFSDKFSKKALELFLKTTSRLLKEKILTAATGFGSCSVVYARFIIMKAVEMLDVTKKSACEKYSIKIA